LIYAYMIISPELVKLLLDQRLRLRRLDSKGGLLEMDRVREEDREAVLAEIFPNEIGRVQVSQRERRTAS
jgi:hypothetical protein